MVVCLVLYLSMRRVKSRESAHVRQIYAMWKKKRCFLKLSLYMSVKPFRPIAAYYIMDNTHTHGYVYTEPFI